MAKINSGGHSSGFASSLIRFCIVVVAVGQIRHTTADGGPVARGFKSASSPICFDDTDTVYFIDSSSNRLIKFQIVEAITTSVELDASAEIVFIVPVKSDVKTKFIGGYGSGVALYKWNGSSTKKRKEEIGLSVTNVPSELVKCGSADVSGRLWIGASYEENYGSNAEYKTYGRLYSVDENGTAILRLDKIGVPGGITWSPSSGDIYHSDTTAKTIVSHTFDSDTGKIHDDRRVVFDFKAMGINGIPGGITIDTSGNLWVACFAYPYIIQIDPEAENKLLQKVDLPTLSGTTSVAFGSSDKTELYVTTDTEMFVVTNTGSEGFSVKKINIDHWPTPAP